MDNVFLKMIVLMTQKMSVYNINNRKIIFFRNMVENAKLWSKSNLAPFPDCKMFPSLKWLKMDKYINSTFPGIWHLSSSKVPLWHHLVSSLCASSDCYSPTLLRSPSTWSHCVGDTLLCLVQCFDCGWVDTGTSFLFSSKNIKNGV